MPVQARSSLVSRERASRSWIISSTLVSYSSIPTVSMSDCINSHPNVSVERWKQLPLCREPLAVQFGSDRPSTQDIPHLQQTRRPLCLRRRHVIASLSSISECFQRIGNCLPMVRQSHDYIWLHCMDHPPDHIPTFPERLRVQWDPPSTAIQDLGAAICHVLRIIHSDYPHIDEWVSGLFPRAVYGFIFPGCLYNTSYCRCPVPGP